MNNKYTTTTQRRRETMDLPKLMKADCNHFIPADSNPRGQRYEPVSSRWLPVFLCTTCASKLNQNNQRPDFITTMDGPVAVRKGR
jgi:hypothetical protein